MHLAEVVAKADEVWPVESCQVLAIRAAPRPANARADLQVAATPLRSHLFGDVAPRARNTNGAFAFSS